MKKLLFALVLLASPAAAQTLPNVNLTFEPFHASGIYRIGERVGWTVRAPMGSAIRKYSYEIRENNLKVIKSGVLDVSSGAGVLETSLDHPGMIYARAVLHRRAGARTSANTTRTGQDDRGRGGGAGTDHVRLSPSPPTSTVSGPASWRR